MQVRAIESPVWTAKPTRQPMRILVIEDDRESASWLVKGLAESGHVADLAAAHVAALTACRGGQYAAYNLGTGEGISINDVIARSRAITGKPIPAEAAARRPGDPASLVADASLARKALLWEPSCSGIDNIIGSAWRWMSEHRSRVAGR